MVDFNLSNGASKGGRVNIDGLIGSGALYSMISSALDLSTAGFSGSGGLTLLWADRVQPYFQWDVYNIYGIKGIQNKILP